MPLLVLCGLPSFPATACAILTKERAAELHQRHIEEFKKAASTMKEEADLVFIGRLSKLTFREETVKSPSGQDQVLQTHQATFSVDQAIKGQYAKEGKILRTNHIPTDAQEMSGREEAAFIGEQQ